MGGTCQPPHSSGTGEAYPTAASPGAGEAYRTAASLTVASQSFVAVLMAQSGLQSPAHFQGIWHSILLERGKLVTLRNTNSLNTIC